MKLHHHLECQLYILSLNKMAALSPLGQLNSPPGQSPSDQACLCQGSHPRGLLFVVGLTVQLDGHVTRGQALQETSDWKGGCGRQ